MITEHPFQDHLDVMTLYIEEPIIGQSVIEVPVRDLRVWKGYPGYPNDVHYERCTLVYRGVVFSVRKISEYETPEGKGFKREYIITDGPFVPVKAQIFQFQLVGVSLELNAYVDWHILAEDVSIKDGVYAAP